MKIGTTDFSFKVQTPLSCKRKRVDNSDIEELRIANYDATWRVLEGYLTQLDTVLDSRVAGLIFKRKLVDTLKMVFMLKAGKSIQAIEESEQKSFNRNMAGNGGQVEQQRHDKYVYHQSGRSSSNVATNHEALNQEIVSFLQLVTTFIKEANDFLPSFSARENKYKQELAPIMDLYQKTFEQK